ncbi:MAG: ATP-binding protein [Thiogranum sp.]
MSGPLSHSQKKIYLAVVVIWLALFVTAMSIIVVLDLQRAKVLFTENANMHFRQASERVQTNESVLEGFAAMVGVSGDPGSKSIRSYARKMLERYPHIFRFQIVEKIPRERLESFSDYMREHLAMDFTLKSFGYKTDRHWQPVRQAPYYLPIVFLEPCPEESLKLLGLDLASNDFLARAVLASQKVGHPVASAPFNLVQGNLAYMIQRPITTPDNHDSRYPAPSGAQAGFASLVILADTLLDREHHPLRGMRELLYTRPYSATDPRGYLHRHEAPPTSWLEAQLFPRLRVSMPLASSSQPFVLLVEHQLGWGVISWGKLALTLLIGLLTFGVMLVYARLYLRHEMARAERYLQIARAIIIGLDRDGRVNLINRRGCEILGYTEKEIMGRNWFETVLPEQRRAAAVRRFRRMMAGDLEPVTRYESEILTKQGVWCHIDWNSTLEENAKGEIVGLLSSGQDISARKRAEEQAQRHHRDMAHVTRLSTMGEMATGMAHELSQPLTALVSYCGTAASLLKAMPSPPAQLADIVSRAAEQAHRAADIIRQLRSFVSKEDRNREIFDLNQAIRNVLVFLRWDVQRSGVKVVFEPASTACTISANRIQIEQVLVNLIRNSIEAIEQAQIADGAIHIRTRPLPENGVETLVSDNGPGVDSAMGDRIFDQFRTSKKNGMGMGLSISRTIVDAHGGKLWVDRGRRDGALFGFELPAAESVGVSERLRGYRKETLQ